MDWLQVAGTAGPLGGLVSVLVLNATAFAKGWCFTKREMDAAQARILSLESQLEKAHTDYNTLQQESNERYNLLLKEGLMTQNAIIEAVKELVGQR